jgi:hypothetical protein
VVEEASEVAAVVVAVAAVDVAVGAVVGGKRRES